MQVSGDGFEDGNNEGINGMTTEGRSSSTLVDLALGSQTQGLERVTEFCQLSSCGAQDSVIL